MPVRKIVQIDEEKCDGCGLCVPSCAEGAIQIINGKAKVVSDSFCDGMGACLGDCPQGAITIVEREAAEFDEKAVEKHLTHKESIKINPIHTIAHQAHACPGSAMREFRAVASNQSDIPAAGTPSQLRHWPVQLMLVPPQAPFLKRSDILICADCVPFAMADFHGRFLKGRSLLVGCPKLDNLSFYYEKIKDIIRVAEPVKLTVVKMEVPCCNGIAQAVVQARNEINPGLPLEIITIGIRGEVLQETSAQPAPAK